MGLSVEVLEVLRWELQEDGSFTSDWGPGGHWCGVCGADSQYRVAVAQSQRYDGKATAPKAPLPDDADH